MNTQAETTANYKAVLALLGGEKAVTCLPGDIFTWPIVTKEHEEAVLRVIRAGSMSGLDVTMEFETEYARQIGRKYALACNNGTAAIHCALYGLGIGAGDEVICPSLTYWASITQVFSLGATPVFADIDPETLCVSPADIEKRISPHTKAIVVVHYAGMPAAMDEIMAIARRHKLKVFEDCSHAHAALYKGREVGTFGDAAGFSLMSGKSLAVGEAGIMFTDDRRVYERAILLGHYERHDKIESADLKKYAGIPCGGYKYRMHQASSAFGLVQLKLYRAQFAQIDKAMNYFCDLIDKIHGLKAVRPLAGTNTTKGGWYFPIAHYYPEKFKGLSVKRFSDAVRAEGVPCGAGCNKPLHQHPLFTEMDVYGQGKPTRIANSNGTTMKSYPEKLPVTEVINSRIIALPWFKHYRPDIIKEYAEAFRKVSQNYEKLLPGDKGSENVGGYSTSFRSR